MFDEAAWLGSQLGAMEAVLAALVEQNSFTGNKAGGDRVGRLLEQAFVLPGLALERVKSSAFADHLVLRTKGRAGAAPIALVGHLDTVFPPGTFEGYRVDGDLRRGPGVLDMKGGLVVVAWALKALAAAGRLEAAPPLRVVVVADEEVGSPEGAPLLRRVIDGASACLVFESGRANDAIVTRRKGTASAVCEAHGKAAHAGNNHADGANALWALSRFVDAAQALTDAPAGTTVNVGLLEGGTSRNTVPAWGKAELDLRYRTRAARAGVVSGLEAAAQRSSASVPGTSLTLSVTAGRLPMQPTEATRGVFDAYAACARAVGLGAEEAPEQGGGSDGNTAAAMGIATIDALGPRGTGFHTLDECIDVTTLVPRAVALARFLMQA